MTPENGDYESGWPCSRCYWWGVFIGGSLMTLLTWAAMR